jgi:5,10-methylenetetrahydromethanopterin reductase
MEPEDWRPFSNTIEAVRAIRNLTAGETLGFSPTTFDASPDLRLDLPLATAVPVDVGAVSERMMEASGEYADGVQLGAITSVAYTRWATERLAAGAARAGRDLGDLLVSANVLTSVDHDRRAARNAVRPVLAYYLARVEGVVVTESGADPDAVRAVREAVLENGVDAGAAMIAEELIDVFAVAGTVDDVVAALAPYADAGLDLPLAWYTLGTDPAAAIRILAEQVRPALIATRP